MSTVLPLVNTTQIWRYVDMPRFLSILENRALFFTCVDQLEDPFEGSLSRSDYASYEDGLWEASGDSGIANGLWLEENRKNSIDQRRYTFCSCWHQSSFESAAMWKLYSDIGKGLAIQSTVERLRHCLPAYIKTEPVRYIDFETESTLERRFLTKRREFSHERELRAIFSDDASVQKTGINVPIEPDALIEKLVVAPFMPAWFRELVGKIIVRYGCGFHVKTSVLECQPHHRVG